MAQNILGNRQRLLKAGMGIGIGVLSAWGLSACGGGGDLETDAAAAGATADSRRLAEATALVGKLGVGLSENTLAQSSPSLDQAALLSRLHVAWYYNWGATSTVKTPATFVPMAYGTSGITKLPIGTPVALGFNEPDNSGQANLPVSAALAAWSTLASRVTSLGSPATASSPGTAGSWLSQFMAGSPRPRVEFVAVHWYKGPDAAKFKSEIQALCTQFGKPVWVTEFAPQTVASAAAEPAKYSQTAVNAFIQTVVPWMNANPCVQRYAWHDARQGTSALFNPATGSLSATGLVYSSYSTLRY